MLLSPRQAGNYEISLVYDTSYSIVRVGAIISIVSLIVLITLFSIKRFFHKKENLFKVGDI